MEPARHAGRVVQESDPRLPKRDEVEFFGGEARCVGPAAHRLQQLGAAADAAARMLPREGVLEEALEQHPASIVQRRERLQRIAPAAAMMRAIVARAKFELAIRLIRQLGRRVAETGQLAQQRPLLLQRTLRRRRTQSG
jgi:hypothetical protein